jgi:hypothetical protein
MSKDLRDALRSLTKPNNDGYSKVCTVDSVNTTDNTCYCIPINEDADITEVRLIANADTGFLIVPKVGSIVVVSFLSDSSAFVSMFSEISEIQLNGTNYDGLVKVQDLTDKLNNLENKVNTIINTYNSHTHPYLNVTTPATTSPSASLVAGTLTPTIQTEIENITVKQGNGQ